MDWGLLGGDCMGSTQPPVIPENLILPLLH